MELVAHDLVLDVPGQEDGQWQSNLHRAPEVPTVLHVKLHWELPELGTQGVRVTQLPSSHLDRKIRVR